MTSVKKHLPSMFTPEKKKISTGHLEKKKKLSMCLALLDTITKAQHQTNQTMRSSHPQARGTCRHNGDGHGCMPTS